LGIEQLLEKEEGNLSFEEKVSDKSSWMQKNATRENDLRISAVRYNPVEK